MKSVKVFDPAMCCSTGVCGPSVDPALVRFASDVAWLKASGVAVERYNLSQDPAAFVAEPVVAAALQEEGSLPLVLVDGEIVAKGSYPGRRTLADLLGLEPPPERRPLTVLN